MPFHEIPSMSDDRKYRQRGYQDDKKERGPKPAVKKPMEPGAPAGARRLSQDGPKNLNMPGFRQVIRCSQCGNPVSTEIAADSRCPQLRHRHARVLAMRDRLPWKPLRVHGNHYHRARSLQKIPGTTVHAVLAARARRWSAKRPHRAPMTREKAFDDLFKFLVQPWRFSRNRIDRPSARISRKSQTPRHTAVLHPNDWCAGDGADDEADSRRGRGAERSRQHRRGQFHPREGSGGRAVESTAVPAIAVLKGDVRHAHTISRRPGRLRVHVVDRSNCPGGRQRLRPLAREQNKLIAEHVAEPLDIQGLRHADVPALPPGGHACAPDDVRAIR